MKFCKGGSVKGLDLSRAYWENVGQPAYARLLPESLSRAAVGLAGEGSECFGFDDELSRDHDWGPGFCLWLTAEDMVTLGAQTEEIWRRLPRTYLGFSRQRESELSKGRIGVCGIWPFYTRFLGLDRLPKTTREWNALPEAGLAAATNGEVFSDPLGEFSKVRACLLAYYPEDVRRKRLAAHCALAAQAGQYNYSRCMARGERTAALTSLTLFAEHISAAVFLLNRRYRPYYKWAYRALRSCPVLGEAVGTRLERLDGEEASRFLLIEEISASVIGELKRQGLSSSESDFLLPHAEEIQRSIRDPYLAGLHLMTE